MKIGTWNLAGRWGENHRSLLERMECDVWLLTEVRDDVALDGYKLHASQAYMLRKRVRFTSVLSRAPLEALPDPHGASAAARVNGVVYCSSILPWRACGSEAPWSGTNTAERTTAAVDAIMAALPDAPLVWGGDWNHALVGKESSGSLAARTRIQAALNTRRLQAPTAELPHRIEGLLSIDHIALPEGVRAKACRVSAVVGGVALSDHDLYVVECAEADLTGPGRWAPLTPPRSSARRAPPARAPGTNARQGRRRSRRTT